MSGTFQLDSELFPKDPLFKRWTRAQVGVAGTGEGIYSNFWSITLNFGILDMASEVPYFENKWLSGGLHTAVLPHPQTGVLTGFTGTNIRDFSYELNDIDSNSWATNPTLTIDHISLSATGTV